MLIYTTDLFYRPLPVHAKEFWNPKKSSNFRHYRPKWYVVQGSEPWSVKPIARTSKVSFPQGLGKERSLKKKKTFFLPGKSFKLPSREGSKDKRKMIRREGGIEPLPRQRPMDLKSIPRAIQDHPGISQNFNFEILQNWKARVSIPVPLAC